MIEAGKEYIFKPTQIQGLADALVKVHKVEDGIAWVEYVDPANIHEADMDDETIARFCDAYPPETSELDEDLTLVLVSIDELHQV